MKKEEIEVRENKEINDNKKDENKNIIQKGLDIYKKYKEGINYLIFGGVVTVVNFIVYYIMSKIVHMDKIPSNIVAFVISVIVAYITNKKYVFESKTTGFKEVMKEFTSFMSSRIATGILCDIIIFGVMAEIIGINDIISKIVSQVVVVISNYVIGKYFVFSDKNQKIDFVYILQKKNFKDTTILLSLILSIVVTISIITKIDLINNVFINNKNGFVLFVLTMIVIYNSYKIMYEKHNNSSKDVYRLKLYSAISGMLFAFMLTIGEFTADVFFDAKVIISKKILMLIIFKFISYYIFTKSITVILFNYLDKKSNEKEEEKIKINNNNDENLSSNSIKDNKKNAKKKFVLLDNSMKSFILVIIILMICYMPMFLVNYPGIVSTDNIGQLVQKKSGIYRNTHPIFHTFVFTNIVELGKNIFGDYMKGVAFYTIIHMIIFTMTISYVLKYLAKRNVPYVIRLIIFIIAMIYPPIMNHSIILNKDIIFAITLSYLVIELLEMSFNIKAYLKNKKNLFKISIIVLLTLFLRHNAFYAYFVAIILIPLFMYAENRKNKKTNSENYINNINKYVFTVILLFVIPMIIYTFSIKAILKYGGVYAPSDNEKKTIITQVFGRNIKYNKEELSEKDKEVILNYYFPNIIQNLDQIAKLYNPTLSDPLKNKIDDTGRADNKESIKTFLRLFYEQPLDSMQAIFSQTYLYYYPEQLIFYLPSTGVSDFRIEGFEDYIDMLNLRQEPKILKSKKDEIEKSMIDIYYGKIPVVSILTNIAYIVYALILAIIYLFYSRRYLEIIPHTIWFGIFLTCLLAPVNGEIRYMLPAFMSVYILIPILFRRKYKIKD